MLLKWCPFFLLLVLPSGEGIQDLQKYVDQYVKDDGALIYRIYSKVDDIIQGNEICLSDILFDICVWDPSPIFERDKIQVKCSNCDRFLSKTNTWRIGHKPRYRPRTVYDSNRLIYLVSRLYRCVNQHEVWTHDSTFTDKLKKTVPFILFKKSGMTKCLQKSVLSMVDDLNVNFSGLELFIKKQYITTLKERLDLLDSKSTTQTEVNHPSNDFLEMIYISNFNDLEQLYHDEMTRLNAKHISCDHTFKVAANIGFKNPSSGKWVQMYDSVFCILNEKGQIVKWAFTKGTSYNNIEGLFKELFQRMTKREITIEQIFVDNCCTVRNKLRGIVNYDIDVKLDLFHAVQRILKTISHRHPLFSRFLRELRHCFRLEEDNGKERKMMTANSSEMTNNLLEFKSRWEELSNFNGKALLNDKTIKEIDGVIKHARNGCLSLIPPGAGTGKNENVHGRINKFLYRKRIGIKLAYVLFTKVFHKINSQILSDKFEGSITKENFGFQNIQVDNVLNVKIKPFNRHSIENIMQFICISENVLGKHNVNNNSNCENQQNDDIVILSCLHQALIMWLMFENLYETKLNNLFTLKTFPFIFQKQNSSKDTHIEKTLKVNGFHKIDILGDGNCFFSSIICGLRKLSEETSFIDLTVSDKTIVLSLRVLLVNEWKENFDRYLEKCELEFDDYMLEADQFLNNKFFESELGDLMALGMANALGCVIMIFSDCGSPLQVLRPQFKLCHEEPICLVYTSDGKGHYDAAESVKTYNKTSTLPYENNSAKLTNEIYCSCGKNDKSLGKRCTENNKLYKCRCPCFKANQQCTRKCRCKGCENGGANKTTTTNSLKSETVKKTVETCMTFAEKKGEDVTNLDLNPFEYFVLYELYKTFEKPTVDSLHCKYELLVNKSEEMFGCSPLSKPSKSIIQKYLKTLKLNEQIVDTIN